LKELGKEKAVALLLGVNILSKRNMEDIYFFGKI